MKHRNRLIEFAAENRKYMIVFAANQVIGWVVFAALHAADAPMLRDLAIVAAVALILEAVVYAAMAWDYATEARQLDEWEADQPRARIADHADRLIKGLENELHHQPIGH